MIEPKSYKWFIEYTSPEEGHIHGIRMIHYASHTKYQRMEIMDSGSYGRCLVLDGKMQSSITDEFIYHEALVHPALLTHPNPKRVFIVGGGEGATLREVLRHKSVEYCMMVDIDQEVVEKSKEFLYEWHQGEFYEIVKERLSPDGVISLQAGTTALHQLLNFTAVNKTLNAVFPVVAPYQAIIPSFGLPWGFTLASKKNDPRTFSPKDLDDMIARRIKGTNRYYDGITNQGMYLLAKHIRKAIAEETKIIEDNAPLFTYH